MERQVPPLEEWFESYPELEGALKACTLRFVVNLPDESLQNAPRLCFELQEAYWFYLDYLWEASKRGLPKLNQFNFISLMIESTDILRSLYSSPKAQKHLFQEWREYVRLVPVKGAILLNEGLSKCLMVQPWKGDRWTFPRGKMNEDEGECECAIREIFEETGIDLQGRVDPGEYIRADPDKTGSIVKLFLVPGVPEAMNCAPRTRKEIRKIGWVQVCRLPGWQPGHKEPRLEFLGVEPFVPDLRQWIEAKHKATQQQQEDLQQLQQMQQQGTKAALRGPLQHQQQQQQQRGQKKGDRGRGKECWVPVQATGDSPSALQREREPTADADGFVLDLTGVMRQFDLGWQSAVAADGRLAQSV